MRSCYQCGKDLDELGKNRKAIYCSTKCKCKFLRENDPENKRKAYRENYLKDSAGKAVQLWHGARTRAIKSNIEFTITVEWIQERLDNKICEVTGLPFTFTYRDGKQPWSPSLDRVDPTIGYTEENTRVVVWLYNAAKNVFNDSDVLLMATALVNKDGSMKSERSKRERKKT